MSKLGKYLLLDRIAVGGMAEIYRAKSFGVEGFEKIIAIKRILPALAEDAEFVAMFVEEAKIAGQLSHANIAPIYELGKIGDTHFIAMEYVWGKDMLQIMSRFKKMGQAVPPQMAAWIASKMCEALDYAHRKRGADGQPLALIHRDVSPQNVLVSYDGLVKLIDFGIAKAASRATQTQAGVIKGKLGYMSPEQIMGRPLDHRSDIFATTTCLHEMLSGDRLFTGPNDISVIDKVRNAQASPPGVHPALDAIVMKGLARDVADRYQTAGEMQEDLMRYIMMNPPPYSTSALAGWMRTAFAAEMADERAHLDHLTAVAQPGVPVAPKVPAPPSAPPPPVNDYDFESEATVITDSPNSYVPRPPAPAPAPPVPAPPPIARAAPPLEEDFEELSQIVIVENLDLVSRVGRASHAPSPAAAPRPQGQRPPTDYAPTVVASAAYDDGQDDEFTPRPQPTPAPIAPPAVGAPPAVAPLGAPPAVAPLGAPPQPGMSYGAPAAAPLPAAPEPVPAFGGPAATPTPAPAAPSFGAPPAPAYQPPPSAPPAGFSGPPAQKVPSNPPPAMKSTEIAPSAHAADVSTPRIAAQAFDTPPPTQAGVAAAPVKRRSILPWLALMLVLFVVGAGATWVFALGGRALLGF